MIGPFLLFRFNGEGIPSFGDNRESMLADLENNGWPVSRNEIDKYEKEIAQGEMYLSQSKELQQTSEKVTDFVHLLTVKYYLYVNASIAKTLL